MFQLFLLFIFDSLQYQLVESLAPSCPPRVNQNRPPNKIPSKNSTSSFTQKKQCSPPTATHKHTNKKTASSNNNIQFPLLIVYRKKTPQLFRRDENNFTSKRCLAVSNSVKSKRVEPRLASELTSRIRNPGQWNTKVVKYMGVLNESEMACSIYVYMSYKHVWKYSVYIYTYRHNIYIYLINMHLLYIATFRKGPKTWRTNSFVRGS